MEGWDFSSSTMEPGEAKASPEALASLPDLPRLGGVPLSRETLQALVTDSLSMWERVLEEVLADAGVSSTHEDARRCLAHLSKEKPVIAATCVDYLVHHCGVSP